MLIAAEKVTAAKALQIGLVDAIADDPVGEALLRISTGGKRFSPEHGHPG
jgi:enoyl-CoA hydratase/carnithine racemase